MKIGKQNIYNFEGFLVCNSNYKLMHTHLTLGVFGMTKLVPCAGLSLTREIIKSTFFEITFI